MTQESRLSILIDEIINLAKVKSIYKKPDVILKNLSKNIDYHYCLERGSISFRGIFINFDVPFDVPHDI